VGVEILFGSLGATARLEAAALQVDRSHDDDALNPRLSASATI